MHGTRPVPSVVWYLGDEKIKSSLTVDERNKLYNVDSVLFRTLSRHELGKVFRCHIETKALDAPEVHEFSIDLNGEYFKYFVGKSENTERK